MTAAADSPGPPPRRPRQRLSEAERRTQIVAGCVRVLARDGYERATLARIADQAGVSKGLVSHYFGDRDALLEHVAFATLDRLRDHVASRIDLTAPVPDVIAAAVRIAAHLSRTHADELRACDEIVRNLRSGDGTPRLDTRAYEQTYQAQERLLRRGQTEGTLRAFDVRIMAATYQGTLDTMIDHLRHHPDADPDHYATELTTLILAAIRS